ncbi:MAG: MlaD family protein [Deltaproteobacteria bacterium]|nr:MlaD family protein [Deltaproteobacteria bacterium]
MNEQDSGSGNPSSTPEAIVKTRKGFSFSIVWLVPLVAVLIGGWLVYKAVSEKGPTITIAFDTAEGLEAGKTKIRYKDVEVGQVESITLARGLSHVIVTAEMTKGAEPYLTESTRFWVVRARVAAGGVSGLGTIFSGAYIGIEPGKPGKRTLSFKGLEVPPVITTGLPGAHFTLKAETLGSLDIGSPVYYRQIKVGQVVAYELEEGGAAVDIKIFIDAPHHEAVRRNTRFWNASGLDVSVDAGGIKVNTESFVALLVGGIAFDTPTNLEPGSPAPENQTFRLYDSREKSLEAAYVEKRPWLLHFEGSVRGLTVGAPVDFRGIEIGRVTDINLEFDWKKRAFHIPVLIELEPEKIDWVGKKTMDRREGMEFLVEKGLRAQLKQGSLITGQLYVALDMYPDATPAKIVWGEPYAELPTIPTPLEEITRNVSKIIDKFEKIPLEQIGNDLRDTMAHLNKVTEDLQKLVQNLDASVVPAANATLEQTQKTLIKVDRLLNAESPTGHELKRALGELADAARNISILADYLERHPDSLVFGKEKGNEK